MKYQIKYTDGQYATYEDFSEMPVEEADQFLLMDTMGTTNWTTAVGAFTIR